MTRQKVEFSCKLALSSEMLTLPGAEGPRFESLVRAGMRAIQARSDEGGHYQLICNPNDVRMV